MVDQLSPIVSIGSIVLGMVRPVRPSQHPVAIVVIIAIFAIFAMLLVELELLRPIATLALGSDDAIDDAPLANSAVGSGARSIDVAA